MPLPHTQGSSQLFLEWGGGGGLTLKAAPSSLQRGRRRRTHTQGSSQLSLECEEEADSHSRQLPALARGEEGGRLTFKAAPSRRGGGTQGSSHWKLPEASGDFWRLLWKLLAFWRLLQASGGSCRLLEAPGGSWRLLEASGDFWRFLGAPIWSPRASRSTNLDPERLDTSGVHLGVHLGVCSTACACGSCGGCDCTASGSCTSGCGQCKANQCTCNGGTGATGAACPTNGAAKCVACDSGYTLDGDTCKATCCRILELAE